VGPESAATAAASPTSPAADTTAPTLDVQLAASLEKTANEQPANEGVRVQLANLYYDAQRFDLAVPWYEAALKLNAQDIDASTDLAVCYHYLKQDDRALAQIDHSLSINPKHTTTLLNQGFIRAFGKEDLAGAAESWQKVVDLAPNSPEGQRAKQELDGLKANHPGMNGGRGGDRPAPQE